MCISIILQSNTLGDQLGYRLWDTKGCDHQKDHISILRKTCIAHSQTSDNIGKGTLVQKTDHLGDHSCNHQKGCIFY